MSTIQSNQNYLTQLLSTSSTSKVSGHSNHKQNGQNGDINAAGGSFGPPSNVDFSQLANKIANGEFPGSEGNGGPQLSSDQKKQLQGIFSKYKDSDFSQQSTIDSLQGELKSAGLSPEQLAGNQQSGASGFPGGGFPGGGFPGGGSGGGFPQLSQDQQDTLNSILEKYKGKSADKDTVNSLHKDLKNAGLSPEQLSGNNSDNQDSTTVTNATNDLLTKLLESLSTQKS